MSFNEILNNSWFIGIVGGIISGLIVYCISTYFLNKKKRSEYKKDIMAANNAVFEVIRPYIANNGIPDKRKIGSVINSISRRFDVDKDKMISIPEIYEDLIVEFMSNLYIPDKEKAKHIDLLLETIDISSYNKNKETSNEEDKSLSIKKFNKPSVILGIVVAIITSITGVALDIQPQLFNKNSIIVLALIAVSVVALVIMIVLLINIRKSRSTRNNLNRHIYDYDYLKMVNHGTSMNEPFKGDFKLYDYFEDK